MLSVPRQVGLESAPDNDVEAVPAVADDWQNQRRTPAAMRVNRGRVNDNVDYLFVSRGIPRDLVLALRDASGAAAFVETGTYKGGTARWAGEQFDQVFTIEKSPQLHAAAKAEGTHQPNVDYLLGDSSEVMPGVVSKLSGPSVFWLDGHFSGDETAGADNECPAIDEIAAISESAHQHFVFVDDARLFLSTPPSAHKRGDWPSLIDVIDALRKLKGNPHIVVIVDIIIAVPATHRLLLEDWCVALNDQAWNYWLQQHTRKRFPLVRRLLGR